MIKLQELINEHDFDKSAIEEFVSRLQEGDGLLLYCNNMLDSSQCGRAHLIIYGPTRTIPSVDKALSWLDPDDCGGLPSRREQLVGVVDVEDVRSGLEE